MSVTFLRMFSVDLFLLYQIQFFVFSDVKNVEGYIGMLCEKPLQGAAVGPTTACVLQRQYYNLREGDRFFHDRIGYTAGKLNKTNTFVKKMVW